MVSEKEVAKQQFSIQWMRKRHAARVIQKQWSLYSSLNKRATAFAERLLRPGGVLNSIRLGIVFRRWVDNHKRDVERWTRGVAFTCTRIGLVYVDGESQVFPRKILVKRDGIEILNDENGKSIVFHPFASLRSVEVSTVNRREVNVIQQNHFLETYEMVDARGFISAYQFKRLQFKNRQMHEPEKLNHFAKLRARKNFDLKVVPPNSAALKAVGKTSGLPKAFRASLNAEDEGLGMGNLKLKAPRPISQSKLKRHTKWNSQLQLIRDANALFTPLQEPWEDDFLATSTNSGQKAVGETHQQWMKKIPTVPAGNNRSKLYVVMLGDRFEDATTPRLSALMDFLKAYFHGILVAHMPPMPVRGEYRDRGMRVPLRLGARQEEGSGNVVLSENKVLKTLRALMPHDAFAVIAITMNDTYKLKLRKKKKKRRRGSSTNRPRGSENQRSDEDFADEILRAYRQRRNLAGAAPLVRRRSSSALSVGSAASASSGGSARHAPSKRFQGSTALVNLARLDPCFQHDNDQLPLVPVYDRERRVQLLRRACVSLAQTVMKLFGMAPCAFYQCCMNGYNSIDEFSCIPTHVCPVCLRKLFSSIGIKTSSRCVERYNSIRVFCHVHQASFKHDIKWYGTRANYLERMKEQTYLEDVMGKAKK